MRLTLFPGYASRRSFDPAEPKLHWFSFRQATLGLGQLVRLFHSSLSFRTPEAWLPNLRDFHPRLRTSSPSAPAFCFPNFSFSARPPRALVGENPSPERILSHRVNQAYGMTPPGSELVWKTVPPRIPTTRPNTTGPEHAHPKGVGEKKRPSLLTLDRPKTGETCYFHHGPLGIFMDTPCGKKHRAEARSCRRTCQGRWSQR